MNGLEGLEMEALANGLDMNTLLYQADQVTLHRTRKDTVGGVVLKLVQGKMALSS